ncbi:MAG: ABC transporter ATP-binding protein [Candidatus Marinimicrobia bacterium]|nr:ABC transporter ATP-binding protein [Candidatus Neomarinimicrobiota bacterium]
MAAIQIRDISKKFGSTDILTQINLTAEDGEFLVLVGASGCGKSTLLRLIAGLETPDEGTISIGDLEMTGVPPAKRNVAMVFQNYALYPHLSVFENMAFGLRQQKKDEAFITEKINSTGEILQISHLFTRKPKELSGGQRQRVALGRAMVRDPKVFLFDEPLSNLDAKLRQEMRIEIKKLHSILKTTMIYVTHDQTEAMTMGDRIAIMRNGEIEQVDTPEKIYSSPKNKFVASFIGMPQMNFIEGFLQKDDGNLEFKNEDLQFTLNRSSAYKSQFENLEKVVMGIRPEDIHDNLFAQIKDTSNTVTAKVEMVENMGSHKIVHFKIGASGFSAELRNFNEHDEKIELIFDMNRTHLFHPEHGGSLYEA